MSIIQVITGPMKCGKSNLLINEYNKYSIAKKNIVMFKPCIDTRTPNIVMSRNNSSVNAIEVNSLKDIKDYIINNHTDAIFIDEFQFFKEDIKPILYISDLGIDIFISGLNLTSDRKPFNSIRDALCIADKIIILNSVCENCNSTNAIFTFCKQSKNNDILVGDDQYIPVCKECYIKLKQKEAL